MNGTPPPGEQPPIWGPPPGYGYGYGPPPGYGYGYGPPPGYGSLPGYGERRPGPATAAAVLGFVTGGLTALFALIFLVVNLTGDGDATTVLLMIGGVPCAAGLITGAAWMLQRRSARLLSGSAIAAVAVLVVTLVVGVAVLAVPGDLRGLVVFVVLALPLPVVTACLAGRRDVSRWVAAGFRTG